MQVKKSWAALLALATCTVASTAFAQANAESISWPDGTSSDCPFPRSTTIGAHVRLTDRYYEIPDSGADTFYPSWGADGALYTPFADGAVNKEEVQGFNSPESQATLRAFGCHLHEREAGLVESGSIVNPNLGNRNDTSQQPVRHRAEVAHPDLPSGQRAVDLTV